MADKSLDRFRLWNPAQVYAEAVPAFTAVQVQSALGESQWPKTCVSCRTVETPQNPALTPITRPHDTLPLEPASNPFDSTAPFATARRVESVSNARLAAHPATSVARRIHFVFELCCRGVLSMKFCALEAAIDIAISSPIEIVFTLSLSARGCPRQLGFPRLRRERL